MRSVHYRRGEEEELRKDQLSSSWSGHDARLVKSETMGNEGGSLDGLSENPGDRGRV